ncbi:MAG: type II toxin-antitoxin system HicA family toxin [Chloroflexi bacterium]|nr:type II toxin-antitoxin system HicA family toxin [Chloroflexota bacterium]
MIQVLRRDGWQQVASSGGHLQLKHDNKPGRVTVPVHSRGDIDRRTLLNILAQASISRERFFELL